MASRSAAKDWVDWVDWVDYWVVVEPGPGREGASAGVSFMRDFLIGQWMMGRNGPRLL